MRKKIVYILLIMNIIFATILIIKIQNTPKYNEEKYTKVYEEFEQINDDEVVSNKKVTYKKKSMYGDSYLTVGTIEIPKINISYPIISETTDENLKISITKLYGPDPNKIGNLVLVGHNYHNKTFFSQIEKLNEDDVVYIKNRLNEKIEYKVYSKEIIDPNNLECLNQETNGKKEVTLVTCYKNNRKKRVIIKCIENTQNS